jgi:hypothetical protein
VDREIYLLLAGAVIAALVNIVMRLLEFFIRNIAKSLYFARFDKIEKRKLKRKLMGIEEDSSNKPDFWLELWEDLGKLRGGGGTWFSQLTRTDYIIFAIQWLATIGAFLYWVIEVMPRLK